LGQNFNTDSLSFRQRLDYIRGILTFNFSNWKLQPRNRADVHGFGGSGGSSGIFERSVSMQNMRIYPNPASEFCTVEFELSQPEQIELTLRDLTGRLITSDQLNFESGIQTMRLHVPAGTPKGLYLIQAKGRRMQSVGRILIEN
jgi:hypothetical protein